MINSHELKKTIEQLKEYEELAKELSDLIDGLKDSLKAELIARDCEELEITDTSYIIRYATVLSNRFDSTAFKKVMPDIYKAYTKQISSRRFTISA